MDIKYSKDTSKTNEDIEPKFGVWYPIDNAPKDGTIIIAMHQKGEYTLAKWVNHKYEKKGFFNAIIGDWIAHYQDEYIDVSDYTYWMPLPPNP